VPLAAFRKISAVLDPPPIAAQSALLQDALCKSGHGCVRRHPAAEAAFRDSLSLDLVRMDG
jgi:hypothetical protein